MLLTTFLTTLKPNYSTQSDETYGDHSMCTLWNCVVFCTDWSQKCDLWISDCHQEHWLEGFQ